MLVFPITKRSLLFVTLYVSLGFFLILSYVLSLPIVESKATTSRA
jgi:hypothetical protein